VFPQEQSVYHLRPNKQTDCLVISKPTTERDPSSPTHFLKIHLNIILLPPPRSKNVHFLHQNSVRIPFLRPPQLHVQPIVTMFIIPRDPYNSPSSSISNYLNGQLTSSKTCTHFSVSPFAAENEISRWVTLSSPALNVFLTCNLTHTRTAMFKNYKLIKIKM
jgi:hypothetical protein